MTRTLSARDRALLLYVLWPAAVLAALIWIVGPLGGALAAARSAVEQRHGELAAMEATAARAAAIDQALQQIRLTDAFLRARVIGPAQSVNAVVSLQQLLRQSGNTVLTVRVGDIERPRRLEAAGRTAALARIPIDVTARGSYETLARFLRQWKIASLPLKLTKVEALRPDEGDGGLEMRLSAAAFLPAPAETENR